MNVRRGSNRVDASADSREGATRRSFPLALLVSVGLLMAFGTYKAEAAGGVFLPFELGAEIEAAEPVAGIFLPFEAYAAPAGVEATGPMAGIFLPFEVYASLPVSAAEMKSAESMASVILPFELGPAYEACC